MTKIYHKTATINAEQFDGSDEMIEKYNIAIGSGWVAPYRINTIEGWVGVQINSWIATGVNGEHWAIAEEVFKKSYAELPVIPKEVANYLVDCKHDHATIGTSLSGNIVLFGHARTPDMIHDILSWLRPYDNQDLFARAWLDGFQTEEEK
jgi:hypothetical protein